MLRTQHPKPSGNTVPCRVLVVYLRDRVPDPSCGSCRCPASWESPVLQTDSLGKDQDPRFEVWFLLNEYHSCTIVKSKNCHLKHCKSGTISPCWNKHIAWEWSVHLYGPNHHLTLSGPALCFSLQPQSPSGPPLPPQSHPSFSRKPPEALPAPSISHFSERPAYLQKEIHTQHLDASVSQHKITTYLLRATD